MIDREHFKAKIYCAVHRANVRGICVSNCGWGIARRKVNGQLQLDGNGTYYILSMIIEGRTSCGYYNEDAARILNVPSDVMQSFSNGFCMGGYYGGSSSNEDEYFAFNFGKECAENLGIRW